MLWESMLQDSILPQTCELSHTQYYIETFQAAAKHVNEAFGFVSNNYLGQQKVASSSDAASLCKERMSGSGPIRASLEGVFMAV